MEAIIIDLLFIAEGVFLTLRLLFGGIAIGLILGVFLAISRYNKIAAFFVKRIISILRGTPLILQLSFIYFALPSLVGIKISIEAAGIISFGLNSSAYIAEILRSGIEALPKGQFEAAKTLQIPKFFMWKDIILPQVARNIFPSIVNEIISLLKETALISVIGGMDIMRRYQALAAEKFTYFMPLCIAGLYYYMLVLLIEFIGRKIEQGGHNVKNH